jgi:hypothetical protein
MIKIGNEIGKWIYYLLALVTLISSEFLPPLEKPADYLLTIVFMVYAIFLAILNGIEEIKEAIKENEE